MSKLKLAFFKRDVLEVTPNLIGKLLVRRLNDGKILKYRITETEAYKGEEDKACHARFGKTNRNFILYEEGGYTYIYLCYGVHYLFNIVTGLVNDPQAVLIRCVEGYNGPGKLTKALSINNELNHIKIYDSNDLWIEDDNYTCEYITDKRVGIDYADEPYRSIKWRFILKKD